MVYTPAVSRVVTAFSLAFPACVFVAACYTLVGDRCFWPVYIFRRSLWRVAPEKAMVFWQQCYKCMTLVLYAIAHACLLWTTWPRHDPCRSDVFWFTDSVATLALCTALITVMPWVDRTLGSLLMVPELFDYETTLGARARRGSIVCVAWHGVSVRSPTLPLLLLAVTAGRARTVLQVSAWYVRIVKLAGVLVTMLVLSGECTLPSRRDTVASMLGLVLV